MSPQWIDLQRKEVERLTEALAAVYKPEGIWTWLSNPSRKFGGDSALDWIAQGRVKEVADIAENLAGGPRLKAGDSRMGEFIEPFAQPITGLTDEAIEAAADALIAYWGHSDQGGRKNAQVALEAAYPHILEAAADKLEAQNPGPHTFVSTFANGYLKAIADLREMAGTANREETTTMMTAEEFAAKVEGEGGVIGAIEYGLSIDSLDESAAAANPDFVKAWDAIELSLPAVEQFLEAYGDEQ